MLIGQRRMPPHVAHPVPEFAAHVVDRPRGLEAERALEVAVLDDLVGSVVAPEHMVAGGIDRAHEGLTRLHSGAHGVGDPEHDRGRHEGDDRGDEHAHACFVLRRRAVDGDVDDEERDREADAAQQAPAGNPVEGEPGTELAGAESAHERGSPEHAEELPHRQADDDAPRERGGHRAGEDLGTDDHPGVREGEQGQDDEGNVWGVGALQPLVDRDRFAQAVRRRPGVLGVRGLPEGACQFQGVFDVAPIRTIDGNEEGDGDARQGGVHTGGEEGHPHDDRQGRVDRAASARQIAGGIDAGQAHGRDDQREHVETVGVDERDDAERADVVDDSEREEEHAQASGNARSHERESTDEEGRVCGDDDTPRVRVAGAGGDRDEQHGGDGEARERGEDRHARPAPAGQLADRELATNLEADGEEEDRHQRVVDERMQREVDLNVAEPDRQVRLPE